MLLFDTVSIAIVGIIVAASSGIPVFHFVYRYWHHRRKARIRPVHVASPIKTASSTAAVIATPPESPPPYHRVA